MMNSTTEQRSLGWMNSWPECSPNCSPNWETLRRCREMNHRLVVETDQERHVVCESCEECGFEFRVDTSG